MVYQESGIRFSSLDDAKTWEGLNHELIARCERIAMSYPGVTQTELWLCGKAPSHVAGYDREDSVIVRVNLHDCRTSEVHPTPIPTSDRARISQYISAHGFDVHDDGEHWHIKIPHTQSGTRGIKTFSARSFKEVREALGY